MAISHHFSSPLIIHFSKILVCFIAFSVVASGVGGDEQLQNNISDALQWNSNSSCPLLRSYTRTGGKLKGVWLIDAKKRIMLLATPKAGATIGTQLFFNYLGISDESQKHGAWVHDYRKLFYTNRNNNPHIWGHCSYCSDPQWICIKLIRNPIARVVSSYIHTIKTKVRTQWPELEDVMSRKSATLNEASFDDFLNALRARAVSGNASWQDDHFMPQTYTECEIDPTTPHRYYYVPIEALESVLVALDGETGINLNATGFTSHQYQLKNESVHSQNVAQWPFQKVFSTHPSYGAFTEGAAEARVFCCLFASDIAVYHRACSQTWLQNCSLCLEQCNRELKLISDKCDAKR